MTDEELLNRIPKEHYTLHKNTLLKVEDLLKNCVDISKNHCKNLYIELNCKQSRCRSRNQILIAV